MGWGQDTPDSDPLWGTDGEEALAEDEAAFEGVNQTGMEIPGGADGEWADRQA